jgi:hypothetical protein
MVVVGPEEGEEHEAKDTTAIEWMDCKLTKNSHYSDN